MLDGIPTDTFRIYSVTMELLKEFQATFSNSNLRVDEKTYKENDIGNKGEFLWRVCPGEEEVYQITDVIYSKGMPPQIPANYKVSVIKTSK